MNPVGETMFRRLIGLLLICCIVAPAALAQQAGHEPLSLSREIGFDEVFRQALDRFPEATATDVRESVVRDLEARSDSWLAGRPSLQFNYVDDRWLDDRGSRELEYGVQLPLWRPGQKRAAASLAGSHEHHFEAWQQYLRFMVAGRVRRILADIRRAEESLALSRQALGNVEQLYDTTSRLYEAGEIPRRELMQAESLRLEAQRELMQAEAMLVDAERDYETLTGLHVRPAEPHIEAQTERTELQASHPHLHYLQTRVDVLAGQVDQAESAAKGNPVLSIGSRRERGDRLAPDNDMLALSINIPFGGKSHVASQTTAERHAKVDAEVELLNSRRELDRQLHEVEHELFLTRESLGLAEESVSLDRQGWEMAEIAFEQGEINLLQVIQALQQYRDSERKLRLLELEEQRLISEYNQTIGVLP